jgi:dipeptidyl aminopeptidase/acylaminoacyl peptidase
VDEKAVAKRGRINTLKWALDGKLLFSGNSEGIPFLYSYDDEQGLIRINGDLPVGGNVGYGGGDFDCFESSVIFAARKDGLVLSDSTGSEIHKLTSDTLSHASPVVSPDGTHVAYVTSDGENDQIALLALDQRAWPILWIQGADFYMQPAWHPNGKYFAWAEWDHPHMAWQAARVMLATLDEEFRILSIENIAGGVNAPASQPQFSPDGNLLSFIESNGEWQDLKILNLESRKVTVLVQGDDFSLTIPEFAQGVKTYDWFADSTKIAFLKMHMNCTEVTTVDVNSLEQTIIPAHDLTNISTIAVAINGNLAVSGSGPMVQTQIAILREGKTQVVYRLNDSPTAEKNIAKGMCLSWQAPDGTLVHGIFYPPTNPEASWRGLPPAFVRIHSGPTGKAENEYSLEIQYFTSRGFGWLEVNYRGSYGFGASYLNALDGNWGIVDVEDALGGAQCIAAMGLADRSRLMIIGSSAGGFTVLNTLADFPTAFRCGACLYGVSDLTALAVDTHKIELHYTDSLVGKLPEAAALYQERSPLFKAHQITAPLIVFHGGLDEVVPLSQAESLVERLSCPFEFKVYPEEGHGFRQPETIQDYLQRLYSFAKKYLL